MHAARSLRGVRPGALERFRAAGDVLFHRCFAVAQLLLLVLSLLLVLAEQYSAMNQLPAGSSFRLLVKRHTAPPHVGLLFVGLLIDCPIAALRIFHRLSNFDELGLQRQIVPDGVLENERKKRLTFLLINEK